MGHSGIKLSTRRGLLHARWSWPPGLQAVYIHRAMDDGFGRPAGDSQTDGMRLYTRDEYKANNGYRDRLDGIGQITYTVYALSSEDGEMALIRQEDEANRIRFSTGKAKLVYSIREKPLAAAL